MKDIRYMAQPMRPTRPPSLARAFAAVVAFLLAFPNAARAIHHNVTLLGDTQCTNDTAIQLVRVRMDSPDAFSWNNCVKLTFQNAAGVLTGEFAIHQDPPAGNGLVVGIGTAELASTPGAPPIHLVIPSNLMNPNGSVCYRGIKGNTHIPSGRGCSAIDLCVPVTQATCGCDHLPNSGKTLDRCGVCGGNGSTCGCGNGIVDPGEQCDGGPCCSASCTFLPATTVCRAAAGDCDLAETCTGVSNACPADASKAAGTTCTDDGNPCTLDQCDGTRVTCQHPAGNAGAVCRPAAGICDLAESCDGARPACPPDGFAPSSVVCRAAAGVCDVADLCPGNGPTCPADSVGPAGTACPDDGNACTLDQCDGTSVTCRHPPASAGTVCRPAGAPCDVAEVCDGTGGNCPGDSFLSAATECRPAAGPCDVAEFCPGNGPTCPLDAKLPNGSPCSDGSLCTTGDTCQAGLCAGMPVACPASDQCHVAGTCDPATGTCSNPVAPNGTACNDGNLCTTGDSCQAGACTGTPVTCAASDQCHLAGTCDPATGSCLNPPAADGTACSDGNACTIGDSCGGGVCQGAAVACPAPDQCHTAGTCNPLNGICSTPPVANGTTCTAGDACTVRDTCAGGSCVGEPAGPCPANTVAVVEADSYVDAAAPARNFGATTRLEVDASPRKQTFLRIRVGGVGARQVTSARLRMQVSTALNSQSVAGARIHHISSCAWDERTVTWKTRPAIDGPVLSTLGAVALGQVAEFDVTSAIQGDGVYCFAIESPSADGVRYNSREAAAGKPEVIIGVGSQAPATTTPTTTTTTLRLAAPAVGTVLADTYVQSDLATTNFGTKPLLFVDNGFASNPGTTGVQHTFLRVSVSGVGAKHVSSAHLQLQVANVTNAGSVSGGSIHAITNCSWDEPTMTWNTAPPIDGPALVTLGAVAAGQGVDFDVTPAIPGDGVYCFAIDTTSTDSAIYNSREGSGVPPALVVQVAP